jgi:hypothetical protein
METVLKNKICGVAALLILPPIRMGIPGQFDWE